MGAPLLSMTTFFFILATEFFVLLAVVFSTIASYFFEKKIFNRMLAIFFLILVIFGGSCFIFLNQQEGYGYYQKNCEPDPNKNKVAIVIAKVGIYDNERMSSQASAYFAAVKKDLGIDSAGLKKFNGTRMDNLDELQNFTSDLYFNDDVAYIILVGDDLPIGNVTNETTYALFMKGITVNIPIYDVWNKLECANRNCSAVNRLYTLEEEKCETDPVTGFYDCKILELCRDIGVSVILPPIYYSDEDKVDFILGVLQTYTGYHENFTALNSTYERSMLAVLDTLETDERYVLRKEDVGYDLPMTSVYNDQTQSVETELKKKRMLLFLDVHGTRGTVGLGLISQGEIPGYTTLNDYLGFVKENGLPALFVDNGACEWNILKHVESFPHCCWPQAFLKSGVWAYYSGEGPNQIWRKSISEEQTIGMAVRKGSESFALIFGDILAHMK